MKHPAMNPDDDDIVRYMLEHKVPMTRENYLGIYFFGGEIPEELDPEIEAEIPSRFQSE